MAHRDKMDGLVESREVSSGHERPQEQSQGHPRSGKAIMEGSDPSQEELRAWAREKETVVPGQDGTMTVGSGQVFCGFGGMSWPHLGETKPPPDTPGYHADREGNEDHRGDRTALSMLGAGSEGKGKHDGGEHHGLFSKFHIGRKEKEGSKGEDVGQ